MHKPKLLVTLFSCVLALSVQAQMSQLWGEAYNGSGGGQDHAVAIAVDKG